MVARSQALTDKRAAAPVLGAAYEYLSVTSATRPAKRKVTSEDLRNEGAGLLAYDLSLAWDLAVLRRISPSTKQWFDLMQLQSDSRQDWDRLCDHVVTAMGI